MTESPAESQVINRLDGGAVIIAGSGMMNGGRIVHHLKHNLPRPSAQLLAVGYQARGSLGRRLVDGARSVRIHGNSVPVRAKVHTLGGLSAHGDQADLLRWAGSFDSRPAVYLVHGERQAGLALRTALRERLRLNARLARPGLRFDLAHLKPRRRQTAPA